MINMNSPTVQNMMQGGFNPYMNNAYVPQTVQQPVYYNPYNMQNNIQPQVEDVQLYYDPMPNQITNQTRGINSNMQPIVNQPTYYGYNNQAFNGYTNPYLMINQMEANKLKQREQAIAQGKIWRTLLQGCADEYQLDIDEAVKVVESMYYSEPYVPEITEKQRIIRQKNENIARIDANYNYCVQNNIRMPNIMDKARNSIYGYYNYIDKLLEDCSENYDMMEYFSKVYPIVRQDQAFRNIREANKNLRNQYNSNAFNALIDKTTGNRPDSYYAKLMESYADAGVKLETSNGLVITPDEMEVKLPERLLRNRNSQDDYYEKRRKFYDAIFRKE